MIVRCINLYVMYRTMMPWNKDFLLPACAEVACASSGACDSESDSESDRPRGEGVRGLAGGKQANHMHT